jgi:hypothetical protein
MFGLFRGSRPRSMKIIAYPGILVMQHAVQRVGDHMAVDDDSHPAAGTEQSIEVVRYHDYRQVKLSMKIQQ